MSNSNCKFKIGDTFTIYNPNTLWKKCFRDLKGKPLVVKRIDVSFPYSNYTCYFLVSDVSKYLPQFDADCAFEVSRCKLYDRQLLFNFMLED
jgi:hypothetical protein